MSDQYDIERIVSQFQVSGEFAETKPYGGGHINDTYCVVFEQASVPVRLILQRINGRIFKNPADNMENIQRVTAHLAAKVADDPDCGRRVLTLIPARDGRVWYEDANGSYWRMYLFIEKARS